MLRPAPRGFAMLGFTHAQADIADREVVEEAVQRHQPDIIVNAAAYTAVDKAKSDLDRAFAVNQVGPRNVAAAAQELERCSSTCRLITSSMAARPKPMLLSVLDREPLVYSPVVAATASRLRRLFSTGAQPAMASQIAEAPGYVDGSPALPTTLRRSRSGAPVVRC